MLAENGRAEKSETSERNNIFNYLVAAYICDRSKSFSKCTQTTMKYYIPFWIAIALSAPAVFGQAHAPEVFASAGDITDKRGSGTFFNECTVQIKFSGDTAATASSVREVKIAKAIDDTGRDLKKDKEHSSGFGDMDNSGQPVLKKEVTLKNPSRNAHVIKVIEGEASFFSPTEENGGKTIIKDVLTHPGEPLDVPALKQLKMQVTYLTKESVEAAKQKKKANATAGDKLGEGLAQAFQGMFSGFGGSSMEKGAVDLQIVDPDSRLVKVAFLDANGKTIDSQGHMSSGEFHHYGLKAAPAAGTQMVLYVATPGALVTVPFKLENVPLP
jgi:hypothetical protein